MAEVMNDDEFWGVVQQTGCAYTAEDVAEVLAVVDQHEGIVQSR